MTKTEFAEVIREAILSLPQDCKVCLRFVEDPELDDVHRVAAAGALLHVLSGANVIPGMRGVLSYVDDVLVMRLVLARIILAVPDVVGRHGTEFPEILGGMNGQLDVAKQYLGDLIRVLDHAADGVGKLSYHGHAASDCVQDPEENTWLYDTVQEAIVDRFDFDEEEVARAVKQIEQVMPPLQQRANLLA
ncbi:MAG: hypothetical protein H6714_09905 [Myxococcales bacterium]|nr:hypothetical protein [Myxococcales bacterium]